MAQDTPRDALAAVTHADPYPYYDALVRKRPLYWDAALGLWVASSAEAVTSLLTHPSGGVRPVAEPVPRHLAGSPAGVLFGNLVRMNDGSRHASRRNIVTAVLGAFDAERIASTADRWASRLDTDVHPGCEASRLTEFAFGLPVYVVGSLLELDEAALDEVAQLVGDVVRCIFPGGSAEQVERGRAATARFLALFAAKLGDVPPAVVANTAGLLVQTYDATAALISATLLTLARMPEIPRSADALPSVVEEVARFDSPVQNTRRFLTEPTRLLGQDLEAGEAVLVVLAAANRDPSANHEPHRFDCGRPDPQVFTFGAGPHACPGRMLAVSIACAGVARLLANGLDPLLLEKRPGYRASPNVRLPLLTWSRGPDA
jgi:cytochrome P450